MAMSTEDKFLECLFGPLVRRAFEVLEKHGVFAIEDGVIYQSLSHWGMHPVANLKDFEGVQNET